MWTADDERRKEFYGRLFNQRDLVFDVGANLGNRSKVFLELGAKVVAFEPQPYCAAILNEGLGHLESFHLETFALGGQRGKERLFISETHTLSSMSLDWIAAVKKSGRFSQIRWDQSATVRVETLDEMISKHGLPSFIKIDVEGFEHMVLRGLSHNLPALSLEFVPEQIESTKECIDRLTELGFSEFRLSWGESMKWASPAWFSKTELLAELRKVREQGGGDLYARTGYQVHEA
jgi:FkbM family methyltransferase